MPRSAQPPQDSGGQVNWPSTDADQSSSERPAAPGHELFQPTEQLASEEQTQFLPKIAPPTPSPATEPPQPSNADAPTLNNLQPVAPPQQQAATRAVPMRVEQNPANAQQPPEAAEPAPEPAPPEPPPKRRKRRGVLLSLLVLVLVVGVAAGLLFAVPGVASKVGLPQFDPARTELDPPEPVTVSQRLRPADGPAPSPAGVSAALRQAAADPALARLTGVVLDAPTGKALWSSGAGTPLAPGSTNKLLTAAASLLALDQQQTLSTKVVAGDEPGSVVIVGGGDPTLTGLPEGAEGVYPGAARLDDLVAQVERNTGGQVSKVSIDQGAYSGDAIAKGWEIPDIAAGNIAPIVPAMLDGGRTDPQEQNSPRSANPAGDLVGAFAERTGGTAAGEGTAPKGAKVLGEVRSPPVEDLVATMLDTSDNVLAEAMARQVAKATGNPMSFDGATRAVLQTLRKNGFDTTGVTISDGSGLSSNDRMPARLLGSVLGAAARSQTGDPRTAKLRPLLAGLPVAGGTGTLAEERFATAETTGGKGYVRAKTGTLSDVSSLAGVALDQDNRLLVFAFMSNGSSPTAARPALDALATDLRECGCR